MIVLQTSNLLAFFKAHDYFFGKTFEPLIVSIISDRKSLLTKPTQLIQRRHQIYNISSILTLFPPSALAWIRKNKLETIRIENELQ